MSYHDIWNFLLALTPFLPGARLRAARLEAGKSQTEGAEALGLAFQQVHKYEKGTNRISAGRLYELSRLFDVPVQSFVDGLGRAAVRRGK